MRIIFHHYIQKLGQTKNVMKGTKSSLNIPGTSLSQFGGRNMPPFPSLNRIGIIWEQIPVSLYIPARLIRKACFFLTQISGDCTINNTELMKMSEEVVTFVFFTYFSQNFLECGRTTKIAELINEAVVARATRGRSKTTLTSF